MSEKTYRINRRRVLQTSGASIAALGLSGCSSSGSGGDEIHFLSDESSSPLQDVMNRFVDDFESSTDYSVNFEVSGIGGTSQDRMAQLVQSGSPPEAVFGLEHSSAITYLEQDLLAPLDEPVQLVTDQYGETPSEYMVDRDGSQYYLPLSVFAPNIWMREDIFGDIPDTLTWENFLPLLEEADGANGMQSYFQLHGTDTCAALMTADYASANGAYLAERSDGTIQSALTKGDNQQRWIEALEFMDNLGQYSPRNASAGCSEAIQALSNEASAAAPYVGARPKQAAISAEDSFAENIVGRPWPRPEGKEDQPTYIAPNGFGRFDTENSDASEEFMRFFVEEGYYAETLIAYAPTAMPVNEGAYNSDQVQNGLQEMTDGSAWTQADFDGLNEAAANARPLASDTEPPNEKIGVFFGSLDIANLIYDVVIDGMSPEDALNAADQQFQESFNNAT